MMSLEKKHYPDYSVPSLILLLLSYYAPFGRLIMAVIALVLSNRALRAYREHPEYYRSKMIPEAVRTMAVISIVLNVLGLILIGILLALGFFAAFSGTCSFLDECFI